MLRPWTSLWERLAERIGADTGGEPPRPVAFVVPRPGTGQPEPRALIDGVANFLGQVRVDPVSAASADVPYSAAYVNFEPGARSAWQTHPAGQRLIVTAGVGRTSVWGGPVVEIKVGDAVGCPPGVKHWHGAAAPNRVKASFGVAAEGPRTFRSLRAGPRRPHPHRPVYRTRSGEA